MNREVPDNIKKLIRAVVLSSPKRCVELGNFLREYHRYVHARFMYRNLGFNDELEALQSIPDVVKLDQKPSAQGGYIITAIWRNDLKLPSFLKYNAILQRTGANDNQNLDFGGAAQGGNTRFLNNGSRRKQPDPFQHSSSIQNKEPTLNSKQKASRPHQVHARSDRGPTPLGDSQNVCRTVTNKGARSPPPPLDEYQDMSRSTTNKARAPPLFEDSRSFQDQVPQSAMRKPFGNSEYCGPSRMNNHQASAAKVEDNSDFIEICVVNFPYGMSKSNVYELVRDFHPMKIVMGNNQCLPYPDDMTYAYVYFLSAEKAQDCIEVLDNFLYEDNVIYAFPSSEDEIGSDVYLEDEEIVSNHSRNSHKQRNHNESMDEVSHTFSHQVHMEDKRNQRHHERYANQQTSFNQKRNNRRAK